MIDQTSWWQLALIGAMTTPLMYAFIATFVSICSGELFNKGIRHHIIRDIKGSMKLLMTGSFVNGLFLCFIRDSSLSRLHHEDITRTDFLMFPLVLLTTDIVFYIGHRLLHLNLFYLMFHKTHHQSSPATSYATLNLGLVDYLIEGPLAAFLPAFLIPINFNLFYLTTVFNLLWGCYLHNYSCHSLGSIISSSEKHQIHHSHGWINSNFGYYTCIWDHLLGTYH